MRAKMLLRHSLSVISEDEMPLIAHLFAFQGYSCPFTGIGNGIIGKIAEHTVKQASITLHHDVLRQLIIESHVMSSWRTNPVSSLISFTIIVISTASKSIISGTVIQALKVEISWSREVSRSLCA